MCCWNQSGFVPVMNSQIQVRYIAIVYLTEEGQSLEIIMVDGGTHYFGFDNAEEAREHLERLIAAQECVYFNEMEKATAHD